MTHRLVLKLALALHPDLFLHSLDDTQAHSYFSLEVGRSLISSFFLNREVFSLSFCMLAVLCSG